MKEEYNPNAKAIEIIDSKIKSLNYDIAQGRTTTQMLCETKQYLEEVRAELVNFVQG